MLGRSTTHGFIVSVLLSRFLFLVGRSFIMTTSDLSHTMKSCKISMKDAYQRYLDIKAQLEEEYEDVELVRLVKKNVNMMEPMRKRARCVYNPIGDLEATQDEDEGQAMKDFLEEFNCDENVPPSNTTGSQGSNDGGERRAESWFDN